MLPVNVDCLVCLAYCLLFLVCMLFVVCLLFIIQLLAVGRRLLVVDGCALGGV